MCGIVGIFHPQERPDRWTPVLKMMTAALSHRGPDEDGFYEKGPVSIGLRRLRVMDLETGSQPISNEDGTITVVCNGEIYDFETIREDLLKKGHTFKTHSDTEVLIHLYEEHGLAFFEHFDGMFAFALVDQKRDRLVIARDRFGIKPLFYTQPESDGNFAFSSELQSLLHYPNVSRDIDSVAIDKFLALSYIPHPHTAYQKIRKLSPGTFLLADQNSLREQVYWDLPSHVDPSPTAQSLDDLETAISASVKKMVRSDVPVGAFLSGGFDSSTVVFNMARHLNKPFHTFSVRFNVKYYDEGRQAKDTSDQFGTVHHEVWVNPEDIKHMPQVIRHFGEPYADPSMIPTYFMSRVAKENVTVVLTGDGGDEVYGGYETYCASLFAEAVGKVPAALRRSFENLLYRIPMSTEYRGINYKLRKFMAGCHMPPLERHAMWRTGFNSAQRRELYQPEFAERLGAGIDRPAFDHFASTFTGNGRDALTRFQYLDIRTYLIDNNLSKVDRMTMAHGLEARIPMLDLGVVKAGLQLPAKLRVKRLETKIGLRKIMNDRLPESVLTMQKKGFGVPLAFWFQGPLKDYVLSTLSPERVERTGVLRAKAVQKVIEDHMQGHDNLVRQLFNLICFVHWHEEYNPV